MSELQKIETDKTYGLPTTGMAPGLALMFNDALYERCKQMAKIIAAAEGYTPRHLIGKVEACFAVVTRSITWKMDPWAVATSTYQTPNGNVGFEGKLVQAILELSGKLEGGVTYEHIGNWNKIRGRWKKKTSDRGKEFAVSDWKDEDEVGLGVIVRAQVKGEATPREHTVYMRECFPRNSTLWALRPSQQIQYTAVRAFANVAAPGLLMGVPFDSDADGGGLMVEVNERPAAPTRAKPPVWDRTAAEEADEAKAEEDRMARLKEEAGKPAAADEAHNPETGELAVEGPTEDEEFSAADAYHQGGDTFDRKRPMRAPPEWAQMGRTDLVEAFEQGYRGAEQAAKSE